MDFLGYDLSTTGDLLNMVLTIGFAGIAIVLILVLVRVYKILGDVHHISKRITDIVELINHYLWQPARIGMQVANKMKKLFKKKTP